MVDKFFPSTQLCPICDNKYKLSQQERIYVCPICNYTADRDIKSAKCIETEGLKTLVPTERRDIKPEETITSVPTMFSILENIVDVSFCRNSQIVCSHY